MKQKTLKITNKTQIESIQIILDSYLEKGATEVIIRPYRLVMSYQQQKLYFFWLGIICKWSGNTKEELHLDMKKRFLIPIFREHHDGFDEMIKSVIKLRKTDIDTWEILSAHILKNTSITDANVSEMREYLTAIDRFAAENNIRLPLPADRDLDKRIWNRQ